MSRAAGPTVQLSPRDRKRLVTARTAAGLTQADLAGRLGVAQAHVSGVEVGNKTPSQGLLERWCAELGHSCEVRVTVKIVPIAKRRG